MVIASITVGGCRAASPEAAPAVAVEVGGRPRAPIAVVALAAGPIDLAAHLGDVGAWRALHARTADGRTLDVPEPSVTYPDHAWRLYLDRARPTLGGFRRPAPDAPPHVRRALAAPDVMLVDVSAIAVDLAAPPRDGGATAPATDALTVGFGDRQVVVPFADVQRLPRAPATAAQPEGWRLTDVLGAAGAPTDRAVIVRAADGATPLAAAEVARATLRRNQRGELRLGVEPVAGAPAVVLHAVVGVDVAP